MMSGKLFRFVFIADDIKTIKAPCRAGASILETGNGDVYAVSDGESIRTGQDIK